MKKIAWCVCAIVASLGLIGCGGGGEASATKDLTFPTVINAVPPQQ